MADVLPEVIIEPTLLNLIVVSYDGEFSDAGNYHGTGTSTFASGAVYEGEYKEGLFHGIGRFAWPDGVVYEGECSEGEFTGKGTYNWPDGSVYEGGVRKALRHGKGSFHRPDGQKYDGEWVDGLKEGKGKMVYNEKATVVYSGEWYRDLRHGYGSMRFHSGNSYEGYWDNDLKSGKGLMIWKDIDEIYGGDWLNDRPHGAGEHVWGDTGGSKAITRLMCNIYRGEFCNGLRQGTGTFFYSDGSQYTGEWLDNSKHGNGIFVTREGRIISSQFVTDNMLASADDEKESAAITTQTHLNIGDVLLGYPKTVGYVHNPNLVILWTPTQELERLLLRFNSHLKTIYRRYADISIAANGREIRKLEETDPYTEKWPKIDRLIYTTKRIHSRLSMMTLGTLTRLFRDLGVLKAEYCAADLYHTLEKMKRQHDMLAHVADVKRHRAEAEARGEAHLPRARLGSVKITSILDFESVLDEGAVREGSTIAAADSRQPIREREMAELLVRCLAEGYARAGPQEKTLYALVSGALETKLVPLSVEGKSARDPYSAAFYSDAIQNVLHYLHKSFFDSLWARVLAQQERLQLESTQVRSLVTVLWEMKGTELDADLSIGETLQTIFPQYEGLDNMRIDPSILVTDMHNDDFYYYLLRIVASDYWVLNRQHFAKRRVPPKSPQAAAAAAEETVAPAESTPVAAVGDAVTEAGTEAAAAETPEVAPETSLEDPEKGQSIDDRLMGRLLLWIDGPPPTKVPEDGLPAAEEKDGIVQA